MSAPDVQSGSRADIRRTKTRAQKSGLCLDRDHAIHVRYRPPPARSRADLRLRYRWPIVNYATLVGNFSDQTVISDSRPVIERWCVSPTLRVLPERVDLRRRRDVRNVSASVRVLPERVHSRRRRNRDFRCRCPWRRFYTAQTSRSNILSGQNRSTHSTDVSPAPRPELWFRFERLRRRTAPSRERVSFQSPRQIEPPAIHTCHERTAPPSEFLLRQRDRAPHRMPAVAKCMRFR